MNRRDFFKRSSGPVAAVAVLAISPLTALAADKTMKYAAITAPIYVYGDLHMSQSTISGCNVGVLVNPAKMS